MHTPSKKKYIIALAMYYKLGRYDPSDKLTQTYRNKINKRMKPVKLNKNNKNKNKNYINNTK